jgi:hypothetical protein
MPAQTRSRTPASAPPGRVYKRIPRQVHFPDPGRSVSAKSASAKSRTKALKQSTLTQIDYLVPLDDPDEAEFQRERARKRRRKTTGDEPPSSRFHTQTLTQFISSREEGEGEGEDEDDNKGDDMLLVADSQGDDSFGALDVIPQTPLKSKPLKTEVPSSIGSPFSPMLDRYEIAPGRSPLQERSTNVRRRITDDIKEKKEPRHEIPDSEDEGSWDVSPQKSLRNATEDPLKTEPSTPTPSARPWPTDLGEPTRAILPSGSLELSVSQEVERQLRSDLDTQPLPEHPISSSMIQPRAMARPSQATTVSQPSYTPWSDEVMARPPLASSVPDIFDTGPLDPLPESLVGLVDPELDVGEDGEEALGLPESLLQQPARRPPVVMDSEDEMD